MIDENGVFTEEFTEALPDLMGDNYYNDPETKQKPTKLFENVKDIKTLVNNYANGQRVISKGEAAFAEKTKGMVKIPDDKAAPEEIAAYHKAIGVPESADKYELAIPEGDDKAGMEVIAKEVRQAAFDAGASAGVISKVWSKVTEALSKQNRELEEKGLAMMKADEEALKTEKKDGYEPFMKAGDSALAKFKNGKAVLDLLTTYGINNHPAIRKFLGDEVAPLVVPGKTILGQGSGSSSDENAWPSKYKYDDSGKPIE